MKYDLLFDSMPSFDNSKGIGDATGQGLELEEKFKATALIGPVDSKAKETLRKPCSRPLISMNELAKKSVRTLEK